MDERPCHDGVERHGVADFAAILLIVDDAERVGGGITRAETDVGERQHVRVHRGVRRG